jgi:energy-coupling factor transporter ATP-binding protein EcfA2
MKLLRVQVPNFRALKDVDISFEPDFVPNIFPIASQNGGGKSTLLQLLFILIHCSSHLDRHQYIQNLLADFKLSSSQPSQALASLYLSIGGEISLHFFVCKDDDIRSFLPMSEDEIEALKLFDEHVLLSTRIRLEKLRRDYSEKEIAHEISQKYLTQLEERKRSFLRNDSIDLDYGEILELGKAGVKASKSVSASSLESLLKQKIASFEEEIENLAEKISAIEGLNERLKPYFNEQDLTCICSYASAEDSMAEKNVLMCRITGIKQCDALELLEDISNKVYLFAPSTQVFLFSPKDSRSDLFKRRNSGYGYTISEMEDAMPGFLTYGFLNVDILISLFKEARDQDFRKAIVADGAYGNAYKSLIHDLESLLSNKQVVPSLDLEGVEFHKQTSEHLLQLSAEDLSHGELKRLSIYAWLKHSEMKDAIVLMDEVEIALHPDWQYQIVSDMTTWTPSNQYLLATHSYELCTALTPAHVKQIPPNLIHKIPASL